ncbi:MAG TPA: maleylpyruvate isomerase family mycothiol-dependent enzyme [Acidimicrobiia bacterium]|nr:maleylpyruvate isomerase family mycothiol-dependent enzyme [Acidimicrobiia bacterium]
MTPDQSATDLVTELHFALAEADSETPAHGLRARVVGAAVGDRAPGFGLEQAEHVSGAEALRRMGDRLSVLLGELPDDEWTRATVRGLDVSGLVGHLIGVERDFAAMLGGDDSACEADHVDATRASSLAQTGRAPDDTREEWRRAFAETSALLDAQPDMGRDAAFHRIALPLDDLLVARAFELWTHDEDIRRATGRPVADPDPSTLTRMTELATGLLPVGVALAGQSVPDVDARLVLTGPGGGTWDVSLDGPVSRARPGATFASRVVVDAAQFCRVAANRSGLTASGAVVSDDARVAERLFAGAAALALD